MGAESYLLLFIEMLFCHIVDDYYLQGILGKMKQKNWWKENAPDEFYKNDYKMALIEHAFSWSFMISLPIIVNKFYELRKCTIVLMSLLIILNTIIHSLVDNFKANKFEINLVQDQLIHICQIIITVEVYVLWFNM
jgi:hypothetical protein